MGNGSNVLVLDNGIKGITAKIDIKKFETFWDTPQKHDVVWGHSSKT